MANYPVIVLCHALAVSTSGYYDWRERLERPARRRMFVEFLTEQIREVHTQSRGTYGSPRVHAELVLGEGIHVGQKRVERLMRQGGLEGIYRRKKHFTTRRDPKAALSDDLVNRQFTVDRPDVLWVGDVTEHPTTEGKVYLATVIDAFSRRVVGWPIADHLHAEIVVDALQMVIWRRNGREAATVIHTDHGSLPSGGIGVAGFSYGPRVGIYLTIVAGVVQVVAAVALFRSSGEKLPWAK